MSQPCASFASLKHSIPQWSLLKHYVLLSGYNRSQENIYKKAVQEKIYRHLTNQSASDLYWRRRILTFDESSSNIYRHLSNQSASDLY